MTWLTWLIGTQPHPPEMACRTGANGDAPLPAIAVGQLPPGIISATMTSRKTVIAICTPCTVVSRLC